MRPLIGHGGIITNASKGVEPLTATARAMRRGPGYAAAMSTPPNTPQQTLQQQHRLIVERLWGDVAYEPFRNCELMSPRRIKVARRNMTGK